MKTIFTIGLYTALFTWAGLSVLIIRQLFKKDYNALKISGLYLINSSTFYLGFVLVLKLAVIVRAPISESMEKSIEILRNQADKYFAEFVLYSFIATLVLTAINILYLKFIIKTTVFRHTIVLLIANLSILMTASYISTEYYYTGLLREINYHFTDHTNEKIKLGVR